MDQITCLQCYPLACSRPTHSSRHRPIAVRPLRIARSLRSSMLVAVAPQLSGAFWACRQASRSISALRGPFPLSHARPRSISPMLARYTPACSSRTLPVPSKYHIRSKQTSATVRGPHFLRISLSRTVASPCTTWMRCQRLLHPSPAGMFYLLIASERRAHAAPCNPAPYRRKS